MLHMFVKDAEDAKLWAGCCGSCQGLQAPGLFVRESLQRSSGDSGESRVTAKFESDPNNENNPIKQSLAGPGK